MTGPELARQGVAENRSLTKGLPMAKVNDTIAPALVLFVMQIVLFLLGPKFFVRTFYSPGDPWTSAFIAFVFLIATAVLFPAFNLILMLVAKENTSRQGGSKLVTFHAVILALSLIQ